MVVESGSDDAGDPTLPATDPSSSWSLSSVWNTVATTTSNITNDVETGVSNTASDIGNGLETGASAVYNAPGKALAAVKSGVSSVTSAAVSDAEAVGGAIENKLLLLAGVALVAIYVIGRSGIISQGTQAGVAYATMGQGGAR